MGCMKKQDPKKDKLSNWIFQRNSAISVLQETLAMQDKKAVSDRN